MIDDFLEVDPALAVDLQALLPKEAAGNVTQKLVQMGDGSIDALATHGSTVTIKRRVPAPP